MALVIVKKVFMEKHAKMNVMTIVKNVIKKMAHVINVKVDIIQKIKNV